MNEYDMCKPELDDIVKKVREAEAVALVYTLGCPGDVHFRIFIRMSGSGTWVQIAVTDSSYGYRPFQFDTWKARSWVVDGPVVDVAEENSTSYTQGMLYGELCGRPVLGQSSIQEGRINIWTRKKEDVLMALQGGFGETMPPFRKELLANE